MARGEPPRFRAFWAHDREAERQALIDFVAYLQARRERWPGLHVYHYAAYEPSRPAAAGRPTRRVRGRHRPVPARRALRRPVCRRAGEHPRLAALLQHQEARAPLHGRGPRTGTSPRPTSRSSSTTSSSRPVSTATTAEAARLLADIADYNEDDCVSTLGLRDWLLARLPAAEGRPARPSPTRATRPARTPGASERRRAAIELEARLRALVAGVKAHERSPEQQAVAMVAATLQLPRPRGQALLVAAFRPAPLARGRLGARGRGVRRHRLRARRGLAPGHAAPTPPARAAPHRGADGRRPARAGGRGRRRLPRPATTWDAHPARAPACEVPVGHDHPRCARDRRRQRPDPPGAHRRGAPAQGRRAPRPRARWPSSPAGSSGRPRSTPRSSRWPRRSCGPTPSCRTGPVSTCWSGCRPRLRSGGALPPVGVGPGRFVEAITSAVRDLDDSFLAVQGPPGTGKTYVGARVIASLVLEHGWRVGVSRPVARCRRERPHRRRGGRGPGPARGQEGGRDPRPVLDRCRLLRRARGVRGGANRRLRRRRDGLGPLPRGPGGPRAARPARDRRGGPVLPRQDPRRIGRRPAAAAPGRPPAAAPGLAGLAPRPGRRLGARLADRPGRGRCRPATATSSRRPGGCTPT